MSVDYPNGSSGSAHRPEETAAAAAKEIIGKATDRARAALESATDQVSDAYSRASDKAKDIADTVDPFVQEKPYLSLGLAVLGGFILGLLLAGRGPRTIYVKPVVTPRSH